MESLYYEANSRLYIGSGVSMFQTLFFLLDLAWPTWLFLHKMFHFFSKDSLGKDRSQLYFDFENPPEKLLYAIST
jgi:hypothetical protein